MGCWKGLVNAQQISQLRQEMRKRMGELGLIAMVQGPGPHLKCLGSWNLQLVAIYLDIFGVCIWSGWDQDSTVKMIW